MSLYTILTVKYSAMSSHLEPANHSSNLGAKIQIPVQVVTVNVQNSFEKIFTFLALK